ncbi:hypothetical protein MNBD_GAMMA26-107 [hydrothermal vent metagenome]|uniref:Starvation lipoprotein Slp paralog n=1 Tax=hydrothermal vent metagenome TaxID=652676 RepID=A0A3B1BEL2_9ZZZZ
MLLMLFFLSGCTSSIPTAVRANNVSTTQIKQVQAAPRGYLNVMIRWGGEIITVQNKTHDTWLELLAYPLDSSGYPNNKSTSEGRFMAQITGFVDPAIYTPGRMVTILGLVESTITRQVGEFPYQYPLVAAKSHYLWPERSVISDPWYDPWYSPWQTPFYDPWNPYWDPYYPYTRHYPWL